MCIYKIHNTVCIYIYICSLDDFNNSTDLSENQLFSEVRSNIETSQHLAHKEYQDIPSICIGWFLGIPTMECNNHYSRVQQIPGLMASQPSPPPGHVPPPEIAGLIKGLLTVGFP